jgi:hypothetical protein
VAARGAYRLVEEGAGRGACWPVEEGAARGACGPVEEGAARDGKTWGAAACERGARGKKARAGRREKAVARAREERAAGGKATAWEAMGEQRIRRTLPGSSQRRFREVLASRFARGRRVAWKKRSLSIFSSFFIN